MRSETAKRAGCSASTVMRDGAVPGIVGRLVERRRRRSPMREAGGAVAVEVDGDLVVGDGVHVAADRGEQAGDVGRAARAAVPGPAMVACRGFPAGCRRRRCVPSSERPDMRAVVERQLHDVGVAPVGAAAEHAAGPEDQADRRAGLGIGALVRQVVVVGEAFVRGRRADAAGDVHLLGGEVVPQRLERRASGCRRRTRWRCRPCRNRGTWRARHGRRPCSARAPAGATGCTRRSSGWKFAGSRAVADRLLGRSSAAAGRARR